VSGLVAVDHRGQFSSLTGEEESDVLRAVHDIEHFQQLETLIKNSVVRFKAASFADGRIFSMARQLRLRGFAGDVEVVGNLVPDQLPMAIAAGVDRVMISAEHAARCVEQQWRDQAAKERFGYQRVTSGHRPDRCE
jgi:uncharacterized protein (DUF934 family)